MEIDKLQYLNLVSRVVKELETALGVSDKTLAEYIINLAKEQGTLVKFTNAINETGAEIPPRTISTIFNTVMSLSTPISSMKSGSAGNEASKVESDVQEANAKLFKALAIPDSAPVQVDIKSGGGTGLRPIDEDFERSRHVDSSHSRPSRFNDASTVTNVSVVSHHSDRETLSPRSGRSLAPFDRDEDRSRDRSSTSARVDRYGRAISDNTPSTYHESEKYRDRDSERDRERGRGDAVRSPNTLQLYAIYRGRVTSLRDFGAFVELRGIRERTEGLVHVSAMRSGQRPNHPSEVVSRGQDVWVKVISIAGRKISLSMKDVDQESGRDLMPVRQSATEEYLQEQRRPDNGWRSNDRVERGRNGRESISDVPILDDTDAYGGGGGRRARRMTSPERFEAKQLIASGVLSARDLDEDLEEEDGDVGRGGADLPGSDLIRGQAEDLDEVDFEIELTEVEAPFLAGQAQLVKELSPIRLVANPDGSLQRAAMNQSTLSKERREVKEQQKQQLLDNIPKDLHRAWQDPLAGPGERHFASELRGVGLGLTSQYEIPDWKAKLNQGVVSYGKRVSGTILEQRQKLPIYALRNEFLIGVAENQVLLVIGETGSGKTTQMTQYLQEAGFAKNGIIGCTQPRRVAATSIAKRVAEEMGVRLGEEVGYSIRFEDFTSPSTVIKYMTDGMLMREYLMDNTLSKYSVLILDEAHERTIHTDILFGLLKALLRKRKDLKLIVTSATLDAEKFSSYFFDCPILTIPGRTFPVAIRWLKEPESDYLDAALIAVMQIHLKEPPGDILVFLTGQEEIDTACETLYNRMQALGPNVPELIILPVYSALPSEMQSKIFDPAPPHARKCIVATNIAEASLTIDGIYYVVDPGFSKQKVFNPKTGMDSLVVVPISQASARQRAGRAGRTGPGVCYRLYTEAAFRHEMLPTSVPEIQRANLTSVVLQLKAMGVNDLLHFDFMDPPTPQVLVSALNQLYVLGALDEEGLLTRLGRKMAEFPLDPQLAKVLLASVDLGCSEEVLTVVAMLSVENVFYRPKDKIAAADAKKAKFLQSEGDHLTYLAVYNAWAASKFSNAWCFENFVQARAMKRAGEVRKQLLGIMDRYKLDVVSCGKNKSRVCQAIASGYFMNVAKKDPTEGYRTMTEGQPVYIHPSSTLFQVNPDMVLYHELVMTTKEYMRNCMVVDPKWLIKLAPRFYKAADASQISKAKKRVRIEPLFDKYNPPDIWRLSKRRG